ncbi:HsdM family class I SAM-dependent methyltransferase [Kingella potus]|uniref:HsdM family class I SAM-dependent methyltransferase n=1 Tax=Kingella potus TaxID=265175 RepID=UPI001FD1269D|nr:N-6 DNA methylase [Kingella potus]UOP01791.1 N-6 DNA methylase [Kingella potus]
MNKAKTLGQVITPPHIVCAILDACGYTGRAVLQRSIMEPACGDGAFLTEIVRRYLAAAQEAKQPAAQTATELSQYVCAIETDETAWRKCIARLDKLAAEALGGLSVSWQITHGDTLRLYANHSQAFDWVVGNPPYIRIHNLPEDTRRFIKRHFRYAVGTTDMYLAFFEMAFAMLKPDGRLGFITPNSFLYNTSYRRFRAFLQQQGSLKVLCDMKAEKVFAGFSTYTAITVMDFAQQNAECFDYAEYEAGRLKTVNRIPFAALDSRRWALSDSENSRFLHELAAGKNARLGDFFDIQYGFATLRDKIFIGTARQNAATARPISTAQSSKQPFYAR